MFCVRRRDVCLSVLLHLILEGWGGGAASESVPLLVCTTTGYMVEDMLRTWGEMQLHVWRWLYLPNQNRCMFSCGYTNTHNFSRTHANTRRNPVIPDACPLPPETDNLPDRQEVSPVCVWSSQRGGSDGRWQPIWAQRSACMWQMWSAARSTHLISAKIHTAQHIARVSELSCRLIISDIAQAHVCFPAKRACLANGRDDAAFCWQSWQIVSKIPDGWYSVAVIS